jgi:N-acetylglucosamine kinase-like BadF-type ATPase
MSVHSESLTELILAVDAGGTKTAACLARAIGAASYEILGRGREVGANPLRIGFDKAVANISIAAAAAAADAGLPGALADRAVLSVAGAADPMIADEVVRRLREAKIAEQIAVVSDVLPVFAASVEGAGIALISGTGSVAYGRTDDGRMIRCGGWGYLLGDDGSGFAIGRAALRFALEDLETSVESHESLTMTLLDKLDSRSASELISAVYTNPDSREVIASLAICVGQAAEAGDAAAQGILEKAARELASLAMRAAQSLNLDLRTIPMAVAGGVFVGSKFLREAVATQLAAAGLPPRIRLVADPLEGCLRLAAANLSGLQFH